jgi:hypothetical protein
MDGKAALLHEVEIALDAVRVGIETLAERSDTLAIRTELQLLQQLVERALDALEALQSR